MTQEEINDSGRKIVNFLSTSLKNREKYHSPKTDMDSDEEAMFMMDKQDEDLLHTALSDVLGALFRTHAALSLTIVQYFYKDVLESFLNP